MRELREDQDSETTFRAALGGIVLAIAVACANIAAVPLDTEPFTARLADATVRRLFAIGYCAQLAAGTWLALGLLLDIRRGLRIALATWLAALCLFLAPVPTIREAPLAALAPLAGVLLVGLVGWVLERSLREQPA